MVADIKSERWPASRRNGWPASVGIRIYRLTLPVVALFYAVAVWYLYTITDPTVVTEGLDLLAFMGARLGW